MLTDIQKLRETTGAGVMACKKAFEETKGDFSQAIKILTERGQAKAEARSERKTGAGVIQTYIHNGGRIGVMLELGIETDFAAKSEPFLELARNLVMHIAAVNPADTEVLIAQPYVRDESLTIDDLIKNTIGKVGENIKVERFCRYEL